VSAAFSLFRGAAATTNGTKIAERAAFAGGLISTATSAHDLRETNELDASTVITGTQVVVGSLGIAKGLIENIPVAGRACAIASTALDVVSTGVEVYNCRN
jgi:hypothetical protein